MAAASDCEKEHRLWRRDAESLPASGSYTETVESLVRHTRCRNRWRETRREKTAMA